MNIVYADAQPLDSYDYHEVNKPLIQAGIQALMIGNGLFFPELTLDQIYKQELTILKSKS